MCGLLESMDPPAEGTDPQTEDFPWDIGVFDAHCHCAERVLSLEELSSMRTRAVVVLATRCEDQPLVADMARRYGGGREVVLSGGDGASIIPGFGRHPWFVHSIYDDLGGQSTYVVGEDGEDAAKMRHYRAVLKPEPEDELFWRDLPTPVALSTFLKDMEEHLLEFPDAIVGEIGIDKAFRLPTQWTQERRDARDPARTPGGREGRALSAHRIRMEHQVRVFEAQMRVAGGLRRGVSVHGVQAHGLLYEVLVRLSGGGERKGKWKGEGKGEKKKKNRDEASMRAEKQEDSIGEVGTTKSEEEVAMPTEATTATTTTSMKETAASMGAATIPAPGGEETPRTPAIPPRICLHSFSGQAEAATQYLNAAVKSQVYFSFSRANNMRNEAERAKMRGALRAIPAGRVLVETDLHSAGGSMDGGLEAVARFVCLCRGWGLDEGVGRLADNFRGFLYGSEG